jgi:hypothetical protein
MAITLKTPLGGFGENVMNPPKKDYKWGIGAGEDLAQALSIIKSVPIEAVKAAARIERDVTSVPQFAGAAALNYLSRGGAPGLVDLAGKNLEERAARYGLGQQTNTPVAAPVPIAPATPVAPTENANVPLATGNGLVTGNEIYQTGSAKKGNLSLTNIKPKGIEGKDYTIADYGSGKSEMAPMDARALTLAVGMGKTDLSDTLREQASQRAQEARDETQLSHWRSQVDPNKETEDMEELVFRGHEKGLGVPRQLEQAHNAVQSRFTAYKNKWLAQKTKDGKTTNAEDLKKQKVAEDIITKKVMPMFFASERKKKLEKENK